MRAIEIYSSLSEYIGVLAGIFQFVAYLVYIRYFLKDAIRPNAISWVMFAYGTAFMLFLEWRAGASWDLLLLPFICTIMSIVVAGMCLKARVREPTGSLEKGAFAADLGLTIGYLVLSASALAGPFINFSFIITGNLTAVTAFLPILASTLKSPDNEKVAPWLFWTVAYVLLVVATLLGGGLQQPELLIYPILSLAMHGGMAAIISRGPKKSKADYAK